MTPLRDIMHFRFCHLNNPPHLCHANNKKQVLAMTDKYKKIDRRYVLSDSSVNVYGFRLLTSGYQADRFRKNPIGYYMHRRDDGIALKWDDITITGDEITATPVINLSNSRGAQTCEEVENGFLNAASVGHIVVLEYSTDPELMLPGQTGPTITQWYNKECSLVDIPGNGNALTNLFDDQENPIVLADFSKHLTAYPTTGEAATEWNLLKTTLQLQGTTNASHVLMAVQQLQAQHQQLLLQNNTLTDSNTLLLQQVADLTAAQQQQQVSNLLQSALAQKKINISLRDRLAADYANNAAGLEALLTAMPAYLSLAEAIRTHKNTEENTWTWHDYEKNDPSGKKLNDLRTRNPTRYQEVFEAKFG